MSSDKLRFWVSTASTTSGNKSNVPGIATQALRFLLFGSIALLLDAGVFWLFLYLGAPPALAKSAGYFSAVVFTLLFLVPTVFSQRNSALRILVMMATYGLTGVANVATFNLSQSLGIVTLPAFLLATAVSSSLNFLLIKTLVSITGRNENTMEANNAPQPR